MTRVAIVSDSHLSPRNPDALANWDAVVAWIAREQPDLAIHLGDLTFDGSNEPSELSSSRAQLDRLDVPWRAIPGNHDIGENPLPAQPEEEYVTDDRVASWRDLVGDDWWSFAVDGWVVVAVDAQLFDSGLDREVAQWSWLERTLADAGRQPVLLLTHKPIAGSDAEIAASPEYFVPGAPRARLRRMLDRHVVPLIVSGHWHQYRRLDRDGRHHVWAPTTWAVAPDTIQPRHGDKRCGVLELTIGGDGKAEVSFVEPDGMRQLTMKDPDK